MLDSVEVFYDAAHPDIFVHVANLSAQAGAGAVPEDVVLLGEAQPVSGWQLQGSFYSGSGYWSPGGDLPAPLSDHQVQPTLLQYRPHLPGAPARVAQSILGCCIGADQARFIARGFLCKITGYS